jgi:hypothetical protein
VGAHLVAVAGAAHLREVEPDDVHRGELHDDGLGAGDRDLGPAARVEAASLSRLTVEPTVLVTARPRPSARGVPQRLERVGGLADWLMAMTERVAADDRVAVAELAGDLDVDGQAGTSARSRTCRRARSGSSSRRR